MPIGGFERIDSISLSYCFTLSLKGQCGDVSCCSVIWAFYSQGHTSIWLKGAFWNKMRNSSHFTVTDISGPLKPSTTVARALGDEASAGLCCCCRSSHSYKLRQKCNSSKYLFVFKAQGFAYNFHNSGSKDTHIHPIKHEICYFIKEPHMGLTWPLCFLFDFLFMYWLIFAHTVASKVLAVSSFCRSSLLLDISVRLSCEVCSRNERRSYNFHCKLQNVFPSRLWS